MSSYPESCCGPQAAKYSALLFTPSLLQHQGCVYRTKTSLFRRGRPPVFCFHKFLLQLISSKAVQDPSRGTLLATMPRYDQEFYNENRYVSWLWEAFHHCTPAAMHVVAILPGKISRLFTFRIHLEYLPSQDLRGSQLLHLSAFPQTFQRKWSMN